MLGNILFFMLGCVVGSLILITVCLIVANDDDGNEQR